MITDSFISHDHGLIEPRSSLVVRIDSDMMSRMQDEGEIETVTLYRPVGLEELKLIEESGYSEFPPRLRDQPIFYPVLTQEYATRIARDWNAKYNAAKCEMVTRFRVHKNFLRRYEAHTVGGSEHQEYWIPSEELGEFNRNIIGLIEVIAEYRSE